MMETLFYILGALSLLAIVAVIWDVFYRERTGKLILEKAHPNPSRKPQKGDTVEIFINGQWNRQATVTAVCQSYLVLYDSVRCPIDHRGRFYAIGEDANGNEIVYMSKCDKGKYSHVRQAERIRQAFNVPEDYDFLTPADDGRTVTDIFKGIKEKQPEIIEEGIE